MFTKFSDEKAQKKVSNIVITIIKTFITNRLCRFGITKTLTMKTQILIFLISIPIQFFSQQTSKEFNIENQEMSFNSKIVPVESKFVAVTFKKTECITEEQRFKIKYENAKNKKLILLKNPNAFKNLEKITLFQNPFRPKTGFADYGYHTLQNQVDHNLTPNNHLLDYNCGTRTYDWATGNHAGTDYILWPYPWKRMQENTMEVIAAAPGMIINKSDGFSDTNCDNNGNPNWNGIIVEHSDGSTTTYMHFKKNSLTTKIPGETVTAGEFFGSRRKFWE